MLVVRAPLRRKDGLKIKVRSIIVQLGVYFRILLAFNVSEVQHRHKHRPEKI